jgi:acetyl-CoA C-acetyltransferase
VGEPPFGTMMPAYYAMYARAHHVQPTAPRPRKTWLRIRVKAATYGPAERPGRVSPQGRWTAEMFTDTENMMPRTRWPTRLQGGRLLRQCRRGSSCLIVASAEKAKSLCDQEAVWILGYRFGLGPGEPGRPGPVQRPGKWPARPPSTAYDMAGVGPKDIDVAEVHDCFTIAEMMAYEDLGFAEKGQGRELIHGQGDLSLGGSIPVNVDGGLL